MKSLLFLLIPALLVTGCSQGDNEKTSVKKGKGPTDQKYLISKDGMGI